MGGWVSGWVGRWWIDGWIHGYGHFEMLMQSCYILYTNNANTVEDQIKK